MKTYKSEVNLVRLVRDKSQVLPKVKIKSSYEASEYMRQFWNDDFDIRESLFAVFLNNANNTIGWQELSRGGITGTVGDVRMLAKACLDILATSVIIAHNHPSGSKNFSSSDLSLLKVFKNGLKTLDIKVIDFLVLTEDSYSSLGDDGKL